MKHTITLAFLCLVAFSCTKKNTEKSVWKAPNKEDAQFYYSKIAKKDDFIIRYKSSASQQEISEFEQKLRSTSSNLKIETCKCDTTLRRYINLEILEIYKSGEPLAFKPKTTSAGDRIEFMDAQFMTPTYISRTDDISNAAKSDGKTAIYNRTLQERLNNFQARTENGQKPFKIAIFDTGYDPVSPLGNAAFKKIIHMELPSSGSCTQRNFVDPANSAALDDDVNRHGSVVTALLASELSSVPAELYPIKVLDKNGTGDLHGLLCALATKGEFDAYNISLGFYAEPGTFPEKLLTEYMNATKAWFFVAAGNVIPSAPAVLEPSNRDLSTRKFKFYPACLDSVNKMISVTTVTQNAATLPITYQVCPKQNYSKEYVQLGVVAQQIHGCAVGVNGAGGEGDVIRNTPCIGTNHL